MTQSPTDETVEAVALKPCPNPWCEAEQRDGDYGPQVRDCGFGNFMVACTSCSMHGPVRQRQDYAVLAWNTRAPIPSSPPSPARDVERVAAIIEKHHRTHVRQPTRTRDHRVTFHQGAEDAAKEILAALQPSPSPASNADEVERLREALGDIFGAGADWQRDGALALIGAKDAAIRAAVQALSGASAREVK